MSLPESKPDPEPDEPQKVHPIQRLMDNPWLLLVLGVSITFISYFAWGWFEIASMKEATLP